MNFLNETMIKIDRIKKSPSDIIFIGSTFSGHSCTLEEFKKLADFEYDQGYGLQIIARDLRIVFSDLTYLERYEYDGLERWNYIKLTELPTERHPIKSLSSFNGWECLDEINDPDVR